MLERNEPMYYFDFILSTDVKFLFLSNIQIRYVSRFDMFESRFIPDDIKYRQEYVMNYDMENSEFYLKLVDELNLLIFLPIDPDYYSEYDSELLQYYPIVKKYTKYYDEIINNNLRMGENFNAMNSIIRQIFDVLSKSNKKTGYKYRGVSFTPNCKNQRFIDMGFLSKSFLPSIASKFTGDNRCCLMCFVYKYPSPMLNISSISYFPQEAEVISYPGEIYTISNKYKCFLNGDIYTIFEVEVIGNYYENNYDVLLEKTKYNEESDVIAQKVNELLNKHIDYLNDKNTFNGIVYLETDSKTYIFGQGKETDFDLDFGLILKTIFSKNNEKYVLGEINLPELDFGKYDIVSIVSSFKFSIELDSDNLKTEGIEFVNYFPFKLVDEEGSIYEATNEILLSR